MRLIIDSNYKTHSIMKKTIITLMIFIAAATSASAQKFVCIDMEYILKNIPAYEMASEQLNQQSQRWQREIDALNQEANDLYKNYQSEMVFLSDEQKKKKQEEILAKEKQAAQLNQKYFGTNGELYKKRESLIKPIQDDIYEACKKVADERGVQLVIDRASSQNIIFASPRIDVSNEVLEKLGYSGQ